MIYQSTNRPGHLTDYLISTDKQNVWIKALDMALQVVLLVQILEAGFPLALMGTPTAAIVLNSTVCALMVYTASEQQQNAISQVVVDTM